MTADAPLHAGCTAICPSAIHGACYFFCDFRPVVRTFVQYPRFPRVKVFLEFLADRLNRAPWRANLRTQGHADPFHRARQKSLTESQVGSWHASIKRACHWPAQNRVYSCRRRRGDGGAGPCARAASVLPISNPGKARSRERIPRFPAARPHEQPLVSTGRQLEQTEADQRLDRAVHDAAVICTGVGATTKLDPNPPSSSLRRSASNYPRFAQRACAHGSARRDLLDANAPINRVASRCRFETLRRMDRAFARTISGYGR